MTTTVPGTTEAKRNVSTIKVEPSASGISQELKEELSHEINNMLSYTVYNGITINTEINALIQNSSVDDLINAHNIMCKNVAPATPKSIAFATILYKSKKDKSFLNKRPLVRNLILLALLFLAIFIATGSSTHVNNNSLDEGIMNNSGLQLLLNIGYLCSIFGLGVIFYLLKSVSSSLQKGTLLPEQAIEYIAQIVLGVIAGLFLSEILSAYITDPNKINLFNKSILALIGGFSSDAIFSILQGVIDRIKSIFIPTSS
jgi:branched-subunit amino acid transport protein